MDPLRAKCVASGGLCHLLLALNSGPQIFGVGPWAHTFASASKAFSVGTAPPAVGAIKRGRRKRQSTATPAADTGAEGYRRSVATESTEPTRWRSGPGTLWPRPS